MTTFVHRLYHIWVWTTGYYMICYCARCGVRLSSREDLPECKGVAISTILAVLARELCSRL